MIRYQLRKKKYLNGNAFKVLNTFDTIEEANLALYEAKQAEKDDWMAFDFYYIYKDEFEEEISLKELINEKEKLLKELKTFQIDKNRRSRIWYRLSVLNKKIGLLIPKEEVKILKQKHKKIINEIIILGYQLKDIAYNKKQTGATSINKKTFTKERHNVRIKMKNRIISLKIMGVDIFNLDYFFVDNKKNKWNLKEALEFF